MQSANAQSEDTSTFQEFGRFLDARRNLSEEVLLASDCPGTKSIPRSNLDEDRCDRFIVREDQTLAQENMLWIVKDFL